MKDSFKDYFSERRLTNNGDKTALFGMPARTRDTIIDNIFTRKEFFKNMIADLKLKNADEAGNNIIEYILLKIEKMVEINTFSERLSVVSFVYGNVDHITKELHEVLPPGNNIINAFLSQISDHLKHHRENTEGHTSMTLPSKEKNTNHSYKFVENTIVIEDKNEGIESKDVNNIIMQIIEKEGVDKVKSHRIFYSSSEQCCEICCIWDNDMFKSFEINEL